MKQFSLFLKTLKMDTIILDLVKNSAKLPIKNILKETVGWTIISISDIDKIVGKSIFMGSHGYATTTINNKIMTIHSIIVGNKENCIIDHIDKNKLNNTRENLRHTSRSVNSQNRTKEKGKYSSDFIGVSTRESKYIARIKWNNKYINIGRFENETIAAKFYDAHAIYYYGIHCSNNNLLSDKEINEIINSNNDCILLKYKNVRKRKYDFLPKYITIVKNNRYSYRIVRNGKIYRKFYDTLEDAINGKEECLNMLLKLKEKEDKKHDELSIEKNNGIAIINLRNRRKEKVDESLVDDCVWHNVSKYKWCLHQNGYVEGFVNSKNVKMHRFIYQTYVGSIPKKYTIDHINNNKLDNRLDNLRLANMSLQNHNKVFGKGIVKYRGVLMKSCLFQCKFKNKTYSFKYMEDAAKKYNELAMHEYGDNAVLNNINWDKKTTVSDLIPNLLTIDYIKNISTVVLFKQIVRKNNWGEGNPFYLSKIRIKDLEQHKNVIIGMIC